MSKTKPNPTPEEIRNRCHDIQETWNRRERWKRTGKPIPRPWTVPIIRVGEIAAAGCDMLQEVEGGDYR